MTIYALAFLALINTGCQASLLGSIKGQDNSVNHKKTNIAGAVVEHAEATGIKKANANVKANANIKATGLAIDKSSHRAEVNKVGGNQTKTTTNDSKMIIYIFGAVLTLMSTIFTGIVGFMGLLVRKMFKQLAKKDVIILDLGNDAKQILLQILPEVQSTIHKAYENGLKALQEIKK